MARIGVGNRVRLSVGGPTMVVVENPEDDGQQAALRCVWFDTDNRLQSHTFPRAALVGVGNDHNEDSSTSQKGFGPTMKTGGFLKSLTRQLESRRLEYPGASHEAINAFANKHLLPVFEAHAEVERRDSGVIDLPYLNERLNPVERALLAENLTVGLYAMNHAADALDMTTYYYGSNRGNDNSDAFRHAYWNGLMANDADVGPAWAKRWGDAHEDGDITEPAQEREMDLFNNEVGRSFRAGDSFALAQAVKQAVDQGRMRRILSSGGPLAPTDSSGSIR